MMVRWMCGATLRDRSSLLMEGGRGRSKKTWDEYVRQDLKSLGLKKEWAVERMSWRSLIGGNVQPVRSVENGR